MALGNVSSKRPSDKDLSRKVFKEKESSLDRSLAYVDQASDISTVDRLPNINLSIKLDILGLNCQHCHHCLGEVVTHHGLELLGFAVWLELQAEGRPLGKLLIFNNPELAGRFLFQGARVNR